MVGLIIGLVWLVVNGEAMKYVEIVLRYVWWEGYARHCSLIDWLIGWLVGWLIGRSIGWLIGPLIGC